MDGTKLDISGKLNNKDDPSIYKQIPESDLEEEFTINLKPLVKSKSEGGVEKDGADEKMLPEDQLKKGDNTADVKFISNEKQNGDAKVDIGDLKTAFVGMGKEELMKYAKDPFWVRLRWFLFILFWLLWAAMLIGAILIIVAAPKCSPPEPRTWWEQGPLTEVDAEATADELIQLKENGVQGVIVTWPEDAYTPLNVSNKFLTFLHRANDVDLNVIVDLKPGVSHEWFSKSENEEENGKFIDYYIWAPIKKTSDSNIEPPNNWKSKRNSSSWTYSQKRGKYYLSPEVSPQLNFHNPKVVEEFSTVLTNFIEAGAKGIRLTGAPSLLYDINLKDEPLSQSHGFGLTDYGFYKHTNTEYLPELGPLLKHWCDIVKNKTENGPFMLSENLKNLDVFKVNNSVVVDLPFRPRVFGPNKQMTAVQINSDLNSTFHFLENKYWPLWQHNNSALPSDVLNIVTLLLPGTTLLSKNMSISNELLNMRKSPSIMHGNTERYLVANKTVFIYSRLTPGNPGYLIALNPTSNKVVVDFPAEIFSIPEEVTVQYFSSNYNETNIALKKKADAHTIPLSPESALVMSYVPQS